MVLIAPLAYRGCDLPERSGTNERSSEIGVRGRSGHVSANCAVHGYSLRRKALNGSSKVIPQADVLPSTPSAPPPRAAVSRSACQLLGRGHHDISRRLARTRLVKGGGQIWAVARLHDYKSRNLRFSAGLPCSQALNSNAHARQPDYTTKHAFSRG